MHMPTRDPGDQQIRETTAVSHTMGKGTSPDNQEFERVAQETGVDGVFLGHIKGQLLYKGAGDVPYYIDGGAGGELYTKGPIGVDHGYWHGFRVLRVDGGQVTTDAVPIFIAGGLQVKGPERVAVGGTAQVLGVGAPAGVQRPGEGRGARAARPRPAGVVEPARQRGLVLRALADPPAAMFLLLAMATGVTLGRRVRFVAMPASLLGLVAFGAVTVAQQSEPTSTPKESLPTPARIWTTD